MLECSEEQPTGTHEVRRQQPGTALRGTSRSVFASAHRFGVTFEWIYREKHMVHSVFPQVGGGGAESIWRARMASQANVVTYNKIS